MNANDSTRSAGSADRLAEFMQLYTSHYRQLYVYIGSLVIHVDDTEDLLQNTSVVLWEKFDGFEPGTNFLAWAYRIAHYQVLRHRERARRRPEVLTPQLLDLLAVESAEQPYEPYHKALGECLDKLPPGDRYLIESRYQPSVSVTSLAAELNRSPSSLSRSFTRIRKLLFNCIQRTVNPQEGS